MAFGANPFLHTLLVMGLSILNHVLTRNSTVALGAGQKVSGALLADRVSVMIIEALVKLRATFMAGKVVAVKRLALSSDVFPVKLLAALVTGII